MAKCKKTTTYVAPEEVTEVNLADLVLPEGEILPEPEVEIPCYTSEFFHTNPYTLARFGPGMRTPIEEIDSWTSSQIEAGILKRC